MTQPVMPYAGRLIPAARELLLDHELLDGAGVAAPRLRPVRHHVAGLDQRGRAARRASRPLTSVDERAHLGADRLGLGRQVDGAAAAHAARGSRSVTSVAAASASSTASSAVARRR